MNLKDELKKGQAFIGLDDNKYYFLGYDYDDQIFFTNLDLWSDKEQSYMTKSNIFIKEVLDEKSKVIEDSTWYYQSMKELDNSTMEEKIKRCFDIIKNSNSKDFELRPTEIGPLVRGQAYSKEFNQYYEVIGFIVENNIYVDKDLKANQKGFFAIYHSNCESTVPLIFERNFSDDRYYAIGPIYLAPIFYKNDNYLNKLQSTFLTSEILNEYICKIRKIKPDESYRFQ